VFSRTSIDVANKDLRKLLEDGCVFISNSVSLSFGNAFITAVQGVVILRLIAEPQKWTAARGPRCEAARILFQNLDYTAKLSQWWERLVDLTIVSLSYNNKPFCEVFYINSNNMSKVPHLNLMTENGNGILDISLAGLAHERAEIRQISSALAYNFLLVFTKNEKLSGPWAQGKHLVSKNCH
jgi:hypothetical protein